MCFNSVTQLSSVIADILKFWRHRNNNFSDHEKNLTHDSITMPRYAMQISTFVDALFASCVPQITVAVKLEHMALPDDAMSRSRVHCKSGNVSKTLRNKACNIVTVAN